MKGNIAGLMQQAQKMQQEMHAVAVGSAVSSVAAGTPLPVRK